MMKRFGFRGLATIVAGVFVAALIHTGRTMYLAMAYEPSDDDSVTLVGGAPGGVAHLPDEGRVSIHGSQLQYVNEDGGEVGLEFSGEIYSLSVDQSTQTCVVFVRLDAVYSIDCAGAYPKVRGKYPVYQSRARVVAREGLIVVSRDTGGLDLLHMRGDELLLLDNIAGAGSDYAYVSATMVAEGRIFSLERDAESYLLVEYNAVDQTLSMVGRLRLGDLSQNFRVLHSDGDIVYVSDYGRGVHAISVDRSTGLEMIGLIEVPGVVTDFHVFSGRMVVGVVLASGFAIYRVDVSGGSSRVVSEYDLAGLPVGVAVGEDAVLVNSRAGLYRFSMGLTEWEVLAELPTIPIGIQAARNWAFVVNKDVGVLRLGLNTEARTVDTGIVIHDVDVRDMSTRDDLAFVAADDLIAYSIDNDGELSRIGEVAHNREQLGVVERVLVGDDAYFVLSAIQSRNLERLFLYGVSRNQQGSPGEQSVVWQVDAVAKSTSRIIGLGGGKVAYVDDVIGLRVLDFSGRSEVVEIPGGSLPRMPTAMTRMDDLILVADANRLYVAEISAGSQMTTIGVIALDGPVKGVVGSSGEVVALVGKSGADKGNRIEVLAISTDDEFRYEKRFEYEVPVMSGDLAIADSAVLGISDLGEVVLSWMGDGNSFVSLLPFISNR